LALAKPTKEEPFLTRHATTTGGKPTVKTITSKMVTNCLKSGAESIGLNPELFSIKSLRKTGLTEMREAGASLETTQARAGHKEGSSITHSHYDYSSKGGLGEQKGPAAMGNQFFQLKDLDRVVPRSIYRAEVTEERFIIEDKNRKIRPRRSRVPLTDKKSEELAKRCKESQETWKERNANWHETHQKWKEDLRSTQYRTNKRTETTKKTGHQEKTQRPAQPKEGSSHFTRSKSKPRR
jgi:hypothetical protein